MPTKKGIRKPRHSLATRELAISVYVSDPSVTLYDVADRLNTRFHFCPPLSYHSIGRWVKAKGLMKSKQQQNANKITARREKYGERGISESAAKKLSEWRRNLWANSEYKKDMKRRLRRISEVTRKKIVELYLKGENPTEIKHMLASEGIKQIGLSTIHQILNDNQVSKRQKVLPLPFERPRICPVCSSPKIKRCGYHCDPFGIKLEPRFQCLACGVLFQKDRVCIKQKYPSYIREFALECRGSNMKYADVSKVVKVKFGVYVNPHTIMLWKHRENH